MYESIPENQARRAGSSFTWPLAVTARTGRSLEPVQAPQPLAASSARSGEKRTPRISRMSVPGRTDRFFPARSVTVPPTTLS